jgi:hypothetical protein
MGNCIVAVSHMSTKIAMAFPSTAGNKHKACGGDLRQISEAGQGRGCGRGGRSDGGCGRGQNGTTFNRVDTSDHTYNFSDNEMTKMGHEGRMSVFERQN